MEESQNPEQTPKQSKAILIVIAVIVVLAVAGVAVMIFANQSQAPTTTQNEETGSNSETDANNTGADANTNTVESATITFTNNGFSPATLTVKKGTKVTVVNNSSDEVQFSSDDHPTHREDPEINMETLAPGESGSFTVTTVGTHGFHDHIDDSKTGTLVVTE